MKLPVFVYVVKWLSQLVEDCDLKNNHAFWVRKRLTFYTAAKFELLRKRAKSSKQQSKMRMSCVDAELLPLEIRRNKLLRDMN